jgi:hypothetical protein
MNAQKNVNIEVLSLNLEKIHIFYFLSLISAGSTPITAVMVCLGVVLTTKLIYKDM